jgi:hypothetical protein
MDEYVYFGGENLLFADLVARFETAFNTIEQLLRERH